jgi:hypothetical protein
MSEEVYFEYRLTWTRALECADERTSPCNYFIIFSDHLLALQLRLLRVTESRERVLIGDALCLQQEWLGMRERKAI